MNGLFTAAEKTLQLPNTLDNDLTLRAVVTDADAEKVIAINAEIHGEGPILRHWFFAGHPNLSRSDWLFIEDKAAGQAVATLSLMPMVWRYAGQPLPVAELGFVATRPAYRRRGLQRILSDAFDQLALSRGYQLAAIEGIPGFYNQFGFEYAVPLVGGSDLEYEQVPDESPAVDYATRSAAPSDISALQKLFDASIAKLDLTAPRDATLWTHQLTVPRDVAFYGRTTVIEEQGRVVGYLRCSDDDWTDRLRVMELAVDDGTGARERILAALRFACDSGRSAGKRGLRLQLPPDHPAVIIARYLGAVDRGYYGWQMKTLDPGGFLRTVGPALEARLAGSLLAGHTGSLVFDLYQSRLALYFEGGELVEINAPEREIDADARMTLKQATQLWLGWRGREAMEEWYPDFWSKKEARYLIDVLFPQVRAYVYVPY